MWLYTKPDKIELRIHLKYFCTSPLIDTVVIDIPGDRMNNITSSSEIVRKVNFGIPTELKKKPKKKDKKKDKKD